MKFLVCSLLVTIPCCPNWLERPVACLSLAPNVVSVSGFPLLLFCLLCNQWLSLLYYMIQRFLMLLRMCSSLKFNSNPMLTMPSSALFISLSFRLIASNRWRTTTQQILCASFATFYLQILYWPVATCSHLVLRFIYWHFNVLGILHLQYLNLLGCENMLIFVGDRCSFEDNL